MTDPTTEAGRALLRTLTRVVRLAQVRAGIEEYGAAERAAGREEERERLMHYIQHEPDCAERTPEGDCVCGLAAILDAPAEEE